MERSVAGVIIRDSRVFVARRGDDGSYAGYWEFPGGKVESGESDAEALAREYLEEFGCPIRVLEPLGETPFIHGGIPRTLAGWLIEVAKDERFFFAAHDALAWVRAEELISMRLVDSDRMLLPLILPLLKP